MLAARHPALHPAPPRSPKLNGAVERAQRTHTEEFYEVVEFSLEVATLNQELQAWEHLQHRPTSPGPGLPYPPTVPSPVAISAKGARVSLIYWTSTSVVFTPKAGPAGMLVWWDDHTLEGGSFHEEFPVHGGAALHQKSI